MSLAAFAVLAAALVSDGAPAAPAPASGSIDGAALAQAVSSARADRPLATIDGVPVESGDVLPLLYLTQTEMVFAALEQAVRRKLLLEEVARLSITVDESTVEAAAARVLKDQTANFQLAAGPDQDFEKFLEQRYGTTKEAYRAAVRTQVLEELFLERAIRFEASQHERLVVRIIVVDQLDKAKEIQDKLKEGANFAALAKTHSIDRSSKEGGLFPPVAADCPHPLLVGLADLAEGQLTDVSSYAKDGITVFRIAKLERRLPAESGTWAEKKAGIEASLADLPIDPFEIVEWDRRVRARHSIEVRLGK